MGELRPVRYRQVLMCEHVGIVRGLLLEVDHGLIRFVGMVEKNILLLDESK